MRGPVIRDLVRLGWPVFVAQLATMLYGVMDTLMAGRYGTADLAAVGIGASIYITVFIAMMGMMTALSPVVAQLFGAGRHAEIGEQVRQAAWLGILLSIAVMILMRHPAPLLALTHAPPEVEAKVRDYLDGIFWGVPALLFFRVFGSFSTAVSRPRAVMVLNLLGLALKVPLNAVLMHGLLGLPELGGAGCAWATALCAWVTCVLGWSLCARDPDWRGFGIFRRWSWPHWEALRHLLAIGIPIGATFFVDITAFTFMTLFIARLGAANSAAHQVAANFAALLYMLPLSIAQAATVLVGQAIGAGDPRRARSTGLRALAMAEAIAVVVAVLVALARDPIAALYTRDPAVRAGAATLLGLVAVYHLVDALQAVAINVLRGYKRTVVPMLVYTVALWGVGLGGGYLLGLTHLVELPAFGLDTPMGARGFWTAAILSVSCAGGLVSLYFIRVSRLALAAAH